MVARAFRRAAAQQDSTFPGMVQHAGVARQESKRHKARPSAPYVRQANMPNILCQRAAQTVSQRSIQPQALWNAARAPPVATSPALARALLTASLVFLAKVTTTATRLHRARDVKAGVTLA